MRTEREFDRRKIFYALRTFKWSNKLLTRGDRFPSRDVTNRKLLTLFQNGRIGYAEDFRSNKTDRKPVEIEDVEQNDQNPVENQEESTEVESEVAEVVQDDEDAFMVKYKGKTFEINRNQIREDGTLTAGGKKAYDKA